MIPAAGPAVLLVDGLESVLSKFPVQGGLDLTGDQDQTEEMQTEAASHAHTHTRTHMHVPATVRAELQLLGPRPPT